MQSGLAFGLGSPVLAALRPERMDEAAKTLARATGEGQVAAAVLHVVQGKNSFTRSFGRAASADAMFLLGSISKPISMTALMTLIERGEFKLDDPVKKFLPQFVGDHRDDVTMRHLLTHVSGLPDQLPENNELRSKHAPLSEFVEHTIRTPLQFAPGSKYQYNPSGVTPRGLGWNVGLSAGSKECSEKTFGHTGSTGTIAWADPATRTICVVLTSLPAQAMQPHPRDLAANAIAASVW